MRTIKKTLCALLILLMLSALLPTAAFAETTGEPQISLCIDYVDTDLDKVIEGAHFYLYRVAEMDKEFNFTPLEDYEDFAVSFDCEDNDDWLAVAATLKGCVLKNGMEADYEGDIDGTGKLTFDDLPRGLYLVFADYAEISNGKYGYNCVPYMLILPGLNDKAELEYDVLTRPKYERITNPDEKLITRKVIKVWHNEGNHADHPASCEAILLCDGKFYDSQTLNAANNWSYTWTDLKANHTWTITETPVINFAPAVSQEGITFKLDNTYIPPETPTDELRVIKVVSGNPDKDAEFTFTLEAADKNNPMPDGSTDGKKSIVIVGNGSARLGTIRFPQEGTYVYTVREQKGNEEGYVYDESVYTVTYVIAANEQGELTLKRTITDETAKSADSLLFTNIYTRVPPEPITTNPGVIKHIAGSIPEKNEIFTFKLEAQTPNAPMPADAASGKKYITISGAGEASFGNITFNEPGEYVYTISELAGSSPDYVYDTSVYTLTYTVTEGDNGLETSARLVKSGSSAEPRAAEFTNRYDPVPPPKVVKNISGSPTTASTFTFTMTADSPDYPMPKGSSGSVKQVTVTGRGEAELGDIEFTEPGVYTYTVKEMKGSVTGYTYDTTEYSLVFNVTRDSGGELHASYIIVDKSTGKTVNGNSLTFTNKFSSGGGGGDLPQTGLLWWPVPVLFLLGVILLAAGAVKRKS